jgi:DeoR/GlpR family transcriptional regulator of sugar metabolism
VQKQARLLKIWKLCRERRRSVGDLAEMCAVKERTIYRDIRALEDIGVSLAYDRGYYIAHEAPLPQLALTPTESRPPRARGLKQDTKSPRKNICICLQRWICFRQCFMMKYS